MAVLSVHLQQATFPRCDLQGAERKTYSALESLPAKLGFGTPSCIAGRLRIHHLSKHERLKGPEIGKRSLLGPQQRSNGLQSQRGNSTSAVGLSADSGDGQGGNTGNGQGGGGGRGGQPPSGGGPSDDGRRRFDLEECLLYSGAVVAVTLGLWTSHHRECRAVLRFLRWASGILRREPKSAGTSKDDGAEEGDVAKVALEQLEGVVQSALQLLSSLDIREQIFGSTDSEASTSEEAPFPLSAFAALSLPFPFAALSLPFLSIFHQSPVGEEEDPPKVTKVWEVQGDSWTRLVPGGSDEDEWVLDGHFSGRPAEKPSDDTASASTSGKEEVLSRGRQLKEGVREAADRFVGRLKSTLLPEGYPHSVTEDYAEYSGWRLGQIVSSQVNGVLCTQALLYAVGLGKGAIPTAAAVNWVLKDGIGYLSKIAFSKYGRHFDVHPKGWRLLCDAVEDLSCGLELLTPAFPNQFLYLGAAASAFRSGAGMGQAATRNSFYASFSKQGNLAELVAKAEAQGMFAKSLGIPLGILVAGRVGHTGPVLALTYAAVTLAHLFCNLRSYQAVQLRTLNPDRATLVLAEFVRSGRVPSIKAVNAEDPLFPVESMLNLRAPLKKLTETLGQAAPPEELSAPAKDLALGLAGRIELGAELRAVCSKAQELESLRRLYKKEKYMLAQQGDKLKVVLEKGARQEDMLRALTQAVFLETSGQQVTKSNPLETSYRNMTRSFDQLQKEIRKAGYIGELVVRPGAARLVA
ncbi:Protein of unknown function DUF647 [Klebsormidium nitens]|uniref:Root UVB sensitive family n=1 Tax=Klebsormidium nitens TaxID=105231 RepID=A0A1Y1HP90_KLENI|nr:Protein of unknown function DUF647 [Klebsormidium nitens]|eukprot:GAQ78426.1 Protein of unknown function DUF647 [Klebsormidium nitens]